MFNAASPAELAVTDLGLQLQVAGATLYRLGFKASGNCRGNVYRRHKFSTTIWGIGCGCSGDVVHMLKFCLSSSILLFTPEKS